MTEHEGSWVETGEDHYAYSVYEVADALLPDEGNKDVTRRNKDGYQVLNEQLLSLRQARVPVNDLQGALVVAMEPHTTGDMSEIIAYAISLPRSLVDFSASEKRNLLRSALEHDISVFKEEDDGTVSFPSAGEIFPATLNPAQVLNLRRQRLEELNKRGTPLKHPYYPVV